MPELTPIAKVPIPLREELDDMSAILMACFDAVDSKYVLRAKNVADLAQYDGVPNGVLVVGTEQAAIWQKTTGGWFTVWSDSGIITSGIVTGEQDLWHTTYQWGRIRGNMTSFNLAVRWDGAQFAAPDNGNITNIHTVTVASEWTPEALWPGLFFANSTSGSAYVESNGKITIRDMHPLSVISSGHQLRFAFNFPTRGN